MWVLHLASALLCLNSQCYPALVGDKTPTGDFQMVHMRTNQPGYGGDVLGYAEDSHTLYAIHRVWTEVPAQHRVARLASADPSDRQAVTGGCINVEPQTYSKILQSKVSGLEIVKD